MPNVAHYGGRRMAGAPVFVVPKDVCTFLLSLLSVNAMRMKGETE